MELDLRAREAKARSAQLHSQVSQLHGHFTSTDYVHPFCC